MPDSEQAFSSTTWEWRRVKVTRPPGGQEAGRSASYGFKRLRRSRRDLPVRITVTYRGGAQSWWLVEARGRHQAISGVMAFEDVMRIIHNE